MDSKGNVRRVFLVCVLHALGSNPAGVRVFRNCASKLAFGCFGTVPPRTFANGFPCWRCIFACWRGISRATENCCFLWIPKVTFGEFFWLVFCMPWARILLAFGCFGTVPPRDICQWFCLASDAFLLAGEASHGR